MTIRLFVVDQEQRKIPFEASINTRTTTHIGASSASRFSTLPSNILVASRKTRNSGPVFIVKTMQLCLLLLVILFLSTSIVTQ